MNWKGIIALFSGLMLLSIPHYCGKAEQSVVERDTITDTIRVVRPVVRDSVMVRDSVIVDSVKVHLPITQKCYRDSTYTAWVSGYQPNLDSIHIYRPTITIKTIKRPKFTYGIQAGYGITPKGFQPYLGVGFNYTF